MRYRTQIALFMVYIIVSISFFSPFTIAQEGPPKACCQKTKQGASCLYTELTNCDLSYPTESSLCEDTSYCKVGCCFDPSEGSCYKSTSKATCELRNGTFTGDKNCNENYCQKGCCVLGNECSLKTQTQCANIFKTYTDFELDWRPGFSETECVNICREEDKGCCITEDGLYQYTTRSACPTSELSSLDSTIGFHKDTFCSSIPDSNCKPQDHKFCLGDDVFWFDSCDNPEDIAEDCDFDQGTLCMMKDEEYKCTSIDCESTYDNLLVDYDGIPRKVGESWCEYDGQAGVGADLVGSRHYRHMCINSEEIVEECKSFREEYCAQAKVVNSPRGDYSEAACKSNRYQSCARCNTASPTSPDYAQLLKENIECCEDTSIRDCVWLGSGGSKSALTEEDFIQTEINNSPGLETEQCKDYETKITECKENQENPDRDNDNVIDCDFLERNFPGSNQPCDSEVKCEELIAKTVPCSSKLKLKESKEKGAGKGGKCVPFVPPGFAFWENPEQGSTPEAGSGNSFCNAGSTTCTVVYKKVRKGQFGPCKRDKCIQNCVCLTNPWVQSTNAYCRTQGDCGAYYNIVGDFTDGGYYETSPAGPINQALVGTFQEWLNAGKGLYFGEVDYEEEKEQNILSSFLPKLALGVVMYGLSALGGVSFSLGFSLLTGIGAGATATFTVPAGVTTLTITAGSEAAATITTSSGATSVAAGTSEAIAVEAGTQVSMEGAGATAQVAGEAGMEAAIPTATQQLLSKILVVLVIISTILTIYDVFFAEHECGTETQVYMSKCLPWEQPDTNKCNLCHQEHKVCDEYRCKSLGKNCELLNPEDPIYSKCIEVQKNDVTSPLISPDSNIAQQQNYQIAPSTNGFTITPRFPAYKKIKFGIQTNEPAKCKLHDNRTQTYDEMPETYFGIPVYKIYHNITLQLQDGKSYTYYVRCKDFLDNKNLAEYLIQFETERGPDLTPPIIDITSLADGSYIKNNITKKDIIIYIDDYNPIECKWDFDIKDYEEMQNSFDCSTTRDIQYNLYPCYTILTDISETTTHYYFTCKDSENNTNEPYEFTLTGTNPLTIGDSSPQGDIFTSRPILRVITNNGAEFGKSICKFSTRNTIYENMIEFFETGSMTHTQMLELTEGSYKYYIRCRDIADNEVVEEINFKVKVDRTSSQIANIYKEGGNLKIILDEPATCEYSNKTFVYGSGTLLESLTAKEHKSPILNEVHIICQDIYNNTMPEIIIYPLTE